MILFLDVESTGLPDFNKRASDPSQPHIVQLAAILTNDGGKVLESHNVIVKPQGWTIPKEASDIHGITQETANAIGRPEKLVAEMLFGMMEMTNLLVAHNLQFDKFMARILMRRMGLLADEQDAWWKALPSFCTMRETTDICQLPGKVGAKFKWPKLEEAYRHFFKRDLENAHDALADVTACKEIYFWLKGQEEKI